jgi:hypothetical protein
LLKEETLYCSSKDLGKKSVVGELYHGNSHTANPKWIKDFLGRRYSILSVVLNASLETHIKRLAKSPDKRGWNELQYHKKFHYFYRTGRNRETSIADEKEQSAIKELFKLKIGTKKEDVIFYRT